jgi:D-beta-D-heptose 7-phosphate kinase/D-beta-D-heptose 1-phosphate adenosyltransferase
MALASADGESLRVPAVARSVYDVSGAGDTVTAVLALMLGAGATVLEAAVLANHAAALEVAKAGSRPCPPTRSWTTTERSKPFLETCADDPL